MLLLSASHISSLGFSRFHCLFFIDNGEENSCSHKYVVEKTMIIYDMKNKYNTIKIIIDKILMKIKYETSR